MKPGAISRPTLAVTAKDREQGKILQAKCDALSVLAESLTHAALVSRYRNAGVAFQNNPTRETLEEFKLAKFEREFFVLHTGPRAAARHVFNDFLFGDVREWAAPIVKKNLDYARAYVAQVTALEKERHRQLTGRELGHSEVIQIAEQPVVMLESIWKEVETIDIASCRENLLKLRSLAANKKKLYDEVRAAYIEDERLANCATDYESTSTRVTQAEQALTHLKEQLNARRGYTPDKHLEALEKAWSAFPPAVATD
jgi:hypothetical protein